ncbi:hypothetical protein [Kitasatospora griseola]|nr:hypothetical protein [Kitasatospora griseola]
MSPHVAGGHGPSGGLAVLPCRVIPDPETGTPLVVPAADRRADAGN